MSPEELKGLLLQSYEELVTVRTAISHELQRRDAAVAESRQWLVVAGPLPVNSDYRRWSSLTSEEQAEVRAEYGASWRFEGPGSEFAQTALAWKRKEPAR